VRARTPWVSRRRAMAAIQGAFGRKRKAPTEQVVPGGEPTSNVSPLLPGGLPSTERARGSNSSSAADAGSDYPIPNFDEVYARMRHPDTGFRVADRRWRLLSYPKCFVGSEAVEWMMGELSLDRAAAIRTGQHLMDAGILHHVTHSEPFSDSYYFFRFQEDDDSSILNMKRVWDTSLPTRSAVLVSQELLTSLACLCEEYRLRIVAAPPTPSLSAYPPGDTSVSRRHSDGAFPLQYQAAPFGIGPPVIAPVETLPSSSPQTPVLQDPMLAMRARRMESDNNLAFTSTLSGEDLRRNLSQMSSVGRCAARPGSTILPTILSGAADDVDYSLLAKSEEFRQYTLAAAELQGVQLQSLTHDEKIAFFANIYNALCLHCYIAQGAPTNVIRRWVFFRTLSYRIAGLDMSLDDIEHGILRGNKRAPMIKIVQQLRPSDPKCQHIVTKRDARLHFVISAGTNSDPPIRILDSDSIQEQLHDATVEFLSRAVKIDVANRVVTLPRIFMWYADDFPSPERELLQWVGQYLLAEPASALAILLAADGIPPTVNHENFNWCVSDTRFVAAVVRRKRRRLERDRAAAVAAIAPVLVQRDGSGESRDTVLPGRSP
jgi:Protein of unknown function, DUF547/Domain found in Dishevelled, Egl-10, and Pleckstrin (DEP)